MYMNAMKDEAVKPKYVETKPARVEPMQWLRWFFTKKVERPIVWEEAFPWP
jgi:hypothetical protein